MRPCWSLAVPGVGRGWGSDLPKPLLAVSLLSLQALGYLAGRRPRAQLAGTCAAIYLLLRGRGRDRACLHGSRGRAEARRGARGAVWS